MCVRPVRQHGNSQLDVEHHQQPSNTSQCIYMWRNRSRRGDMHVEKCTLLCPVQSFV